MAAARSGPRRPRSLFCVGPPASSPRIAPRSRRGPWRRTSSCRRRARPCEFGWTASLQYVGALRFDLKGIACVERQVFAAVEKGRIGRLFIVQFESILDTSDEVYRWKVRTPVSLDGVPYQHNVFAFDTATEMRAEPEAETARTDAFLKAHGLALDDALVMSRFARVVGEDRRRELLFFYMEPLPPGVGRVADFADGRPARRRSARWRAH